jgi:hypothetical protein
MQPADRFLSAVMVDDVPTVLCDVHRELLHGAAPECVACRATRLLHPGRQLDVWLVNGWIEHMDIHTENPSAPLRSLEGAVKRVPLGVVTTINLRLRVDAKAPDVGFERWLFDANAGVALSIARRR